MTIERMALLLLFGLPLAVQLAIYSCYLGPEAAKDAGRRAVRLLAMMKEPCLAALTAEAFGPCIRTSSFMAVRIATAAIVGLAVSRLAAGMPGLAAGVAGAVIVYRLFYDYLRLCHQRHLRRLNQLMPYFMKTVICLCYNNPVGNALLKALDYVPREFRASMEKLLADLDADPNSFMPYESFITAYGRRIKHLDYYFKSLYRIAQSGGSETGRLLDELNQSISDDINIIRAEKNEAINATVSYLGLIPVALLVLVLTYVLISAVDMI